MAVQRVLAIIGGKIQEYVGIVQSLGAGSAGALVALDNTGKIDSTVLPAGIGADTASILASEAISAGSLGNVWNNSGTQNVRNADGSTPGKEANCFVPAATGSGAQATVYFGGQIGGLTGLVPGPVYLSDTTPGATTAAAPTVAGHVLQRVGTALSATSIEFKPSDPIVRA